MNFFKIIVISAILIYSLTGCTFNNTYLNREKDKNDAIIITNTFFNDIKSKKYDDSFKLYSDQFFTVTSKDKLLELYDSTEKKLGDLETTTADQWETRLVEGTNPSGEYLFRYKNHYQKYNAFETLRLIRENNGKMKILAYNIQSEGFLK